MHRAHRQPGLARWLAGIVLCAAATAGRAQDLDLTDLHGTLSGTHTLSGTVTVTGDLEVPAGASLTIEAGTTVYVDDYWNSIFVDGRLDIEGTATSPVVITSLGDSDQEQWGGLVYHPGSRGQISHARFRYGAGEGWGMVEVDDAQVTIVSSEFGPSSEDGVHVNNIDSPTSVRIENCTFRGNESEGIELNNASPTVTACTFRGTTGRPIRLSGTSYPVFSGDLVSDGDGIWLRGTTLRSSGTWTQAGLPYVLDDDVEVGADVTLTIAPGVILKGDGYWESLHVEGALRAIGTAAQPILFTSIQDDVSGDTNEDGTESIAAPDQWGGIQVQEGGDAVLEHCEIRYAGGELYGAVSVDAGRLVVRQSQLHHSGEDGIRVMNVGSPDSVTIQDNTFHDNDSDDIEINNASPTVTACTFRGTTGRPIWLTGTSYPVFAGDLVSDGDGVWLNGTTLERSGTWMDPGLPYVLGGDVTIAPDVTLTLAPGLIIKGESYWESLRVEGALRAIGTAAQPIVFTSLADDVEGDTNEDGTETVAEPDQWGGIDVRPAGDAVLEHCEVRYAGGEIYGAVTVDRARLEIRDSELHHSGEDGIRVQNVGAPDSVMIERNTFHDNESDDIEINDASPTVTACTFRGTTGSPMWLTGTSYPVFAGDLVSDGDGIWLNGTTLERSGTWAYAGIPYVLGGDVRIDAGVTLTIAPGVVVKGEDYWRNLMVAGDLQAVGTADSAIVFTSIVDDVFGDTNEDGDVSVPEPDGWGGIAILDGGRAQLAWCHLRYGGGDGRGLLDVDAGGDVTVEQASFVGSGEDGIYVRGGGSAVIHNSAITASQNLSVRHSSPVGFLDASGNWWGDASGPFDESDDDGFVNPDGQGGEIGDYVTYEPWLRVAPSGARVVVPGAEVDSTPPKITLGPDVLEVTSASVILDWVTDEATVCLVEYGLTAEYGSSWAGTEAGTVHRVLLDALEANTTYYYRVVATDLAGNRTVGSPHRLTTLDRRATAVATVVPQTFQVQPNYPNPFNASTAIRFALPEAGPVRVVVYDLLGQEVAVLAESQFDAGWHRVVWEASGQATGTYLYVLEAGVHRKVGRMLLLR